MLAAPFAHVAVDVALFVLLSSLCGNAAAYACPCAFLRAAPLAAHSARVSFNVPFV